MYALKISYYINLLHWIYIFNWLGFCQHAGKTLMFDSEQQCSDDGRRYQVHVHRNERSFPHQRGTGSSVHVMRKQTIIKLQMQRHPAGYIYELWVWLIRQLSRQMLDSTGQLLTIHQKVSAAEKWRMSQFWAKESGLCKVLSQNYNKLKRQSNYFLQTHDYTLEGNTLREMKFV